MKINKLILPFIFLVLSVHTYLAQCPTSDMTLTTQSTVDTFVSRYSGCPVLPISLEIEINLQPVDYSGLSFIKEVNGDLVVGNRLNPNSGGFQNIEIVRGDLSTTVPNHNFNAIQLFTNLKVVEGTLWIGGGSDNVITGPSQLEEVNQLDIRFTTSTEINGFEGLKKVNEFLRIFNNSSLESIKGFNNLEEVISILIAQNDNLETIDALNNLTHISNSLNIGDNAKLKEVGGFSSLRKANGSVSIYRNAQLEELGLPALKEVDLFLISDNPSISDVNPFPRLTRVENKIQIERNENLTSLDGLQNLNLDSLFLQVSSNPNLSNCEVLCPFYSDPNIRFISAIGSNSNGCNSREDILSTCDYGVTGTFYDEDVNLLTGFDRLRELNGAQMELILDNEVIKTSVTDEDGYYDLNNTTLKIGDTYQIRATHSEWPDFEVIHEYEYKSANPAREIKAPFSTLDSLDYYLNKVNEVVITSNFAGGAADLSLTFEAYDIAATQEYIFTNALSLTQNHEETIETLKRLTLGYKMLEDYLENCKKINDSLAKSIFEGGKAIRALTGLLNANEGLKNRFLNFLDEQFEKGNFSKSSVQAAAYQKVLLNIINRSYDYLKSTVIDPYLASFGNSPEEKAFVQSIKAMQFTIEKTLLNAEGLSGGVTELLAEIVLNSGSAVLTKNIYLDLRTKELPIEILNLALNQKGDFTEAVTIANAQRQITFLRDNSAFELVDNLSANAKNLTDFSSFLESASIALTATGVGAGAAVFLFQGSKVFNAIGLPQMAATIPVLGERFLDYPQELRGVLLSEQGKQGVPYPEGFLDEQIVLLENYFKQTDSLLSNFRTSFNDPKLVNVSETYLPLQEKLNGFSALGENTYFLSTVVATGLTGDSIANSYQEAMHTVGEIESRLLAMDMMTMAYFMDTTNSEFHSALQLETDTLVILHGLLEELFKRVYDDAATESFEEMIAVQSYSYPDSLLSNKFEVELSIQNYGPLATDTFSMHFIPSEKLELLSINGQSGIDSLRLETLSLAESKKLNLTFEMTESEEDPNVYVRFDGVRSIDATLPFEFINENRSTSNSNDIQEIVHKYRIFPNPGGDRIEINGEHYDYLDLIDISGRILLHETGSVVDTSSIPNGVYFVRITKDQHVEVLKWIKAEG